MLLITGALLVVNLTVLLMGMYNHIMSHLISHAQPRYHDDLIFQVTWVAPYGVTVTNVLWGGAILNQPIIFNHTENMQ